MAGLCKKACYMKKKLQKPLEISTFQFSSRLKIQVDSFLKAFTVLVN